MKRIVDEMSSRERLTAYGRGEVVDRIPCVLAGGESLPSLYGFTVHDYMFSVDAMVAVEGNLGLEFGADSMGMGLGMWSIVEALGTRMRYPENDIPIVVEPAFEGTDWGKDDWRLRPIDIDRDGRFPLLMEAFRRLQNLYGDRWEISTGVASPLTVASGLIETETLLRGMVRDKERVHRLLRSITDCMVDCIAQLYGRLGISFGLSDPLSSGTLIGLKVFREFGKPYIAELVRALTELTGAAPGIHICGKTRDRWEDLLETGVSGLSVDNQESMEALKNACGDRVAISGNVPPVEVVRDGSPEDVMSAVRECIRQSGDSPRGFLLSPGCTLPVGTPRENITAFMNAASIYGRGAQKGRPCLGLLESSQPGAFR
nr:uroporphyrinogen decarboxylase family protein [uncultured Fretibacterium sp.]